MVFVMMTTEPNRSLTKTIKSMNGVSIEFSSVRTVDEINDNKFKTDWYLILYDTEYLSYELLKAVESLLGMDIEYDALIFMRKAPDGKLYQSPRMFKRHVRLAKDSFLPEDRSMKMQRILDGWIYEHA